MALASGATAVYAQDAPPQPAPGQPFTGGAPAPAPGYPQQQQPQPGYPPQQQPGYPPQQQPGHPPQQPAYGQHGYSPPQQMAQPPPPAQERLPRFNFVLRGALMVGGAGTDEVTCKGNCSGVLTSGGVDYDHEIGFGGGADFLWGIGSLVRLGAGIMYVAPNDIDIDGGDSSYGIGSDFSLNFVFELTPRVAEDVYIVPRAQVGFLLLIPGDDLDADRQQAQSACETAGVSGCESMEGPHPGFDLGIGAGVLFDVGSVRVRGDLMAQLYIIKLYTLELSGIGFSSTISENLSGARYFFMAGVEF